MAKKNNKFSSLAAQLGIFKNQLLNKYYPIKSNTIELAKFLEVSPLEIIEEIEQKEKY